MKRSLRLIKQVFAFLLVVILTTSANAGIKSMIWSLDGKISMGQNDSQSTSQDDESSNSGTPSEEIHDDDGELLHQNHYTPFGYSIFIPMDPIPLVTHSVPPLKRPPRA